jgi:16S rRNA processing protein RimM
MFEGYVCIGKLTRTHGYNGAVIASLDVQYPEDFVEMESVFIEYRGKLVPFFVEDACLMGKSNLKIIFEDYATDKAIEEFLGASLYLPEDVIPQEQHETSKYIGYKIVDARSNTPIGLVDSIENNPAHPFFVVTCRSKQVLIPAIDQFITHIDEGSKQILVTLPDGLLDL